MSVRKWMFAVLAALSLVFLGCPDASNEPPEHETPVNPPVETPAEGDKTYIEFLNQELFPARIYSDVSRFALFAEVPAGGTAKVEAEPNLMGATFYPTFLLEIEGIPIIQNGPAITARVDEKKVTRVNIPMLNSVETGFAYIKIENASVFSLTLNNSGELTPLGANSTIVMPDETAAYQIEPGSADTYSFMRNTSVPIDFPDGTSEFEPGVMYIFTYDGSALAMSAKRLSLLPAPDKPAATAGNGTVTVTWTAAAYADSYNVYCGKTTEPPASPAQTGVDGTSATITGLTNDATYYVWVQAKYGSRRTSPLSEHSSAVLGVLWTVDSPAAFAQAVSGINSSSVTFHTIALTESVTASGVAFAADANQIVTIRGDASLRSIANSGNSRLFTIPAGITVTLENNVKLDGNNKASNAVYVNGGTLKMNDGSIISGTADSAVYVGSGGAFTMSGGEISGNAASYGGGVYVAGGTFAMSGGETSGNTASLNGGGVYVAGGTFAMSGGEISGNTASSYGGGVYVANSGTFTKSGGGTISDTNSADIGKAAYVYSGAKRRNTAVGPSVNLDSRAADSAGGWEGVVWAVDSTAAFAQAVSGINSSPVGFHTIVLTENVTASGVTFAAGANQTITIRGDASLRSIANSGNSCLFTVSAGITVTLENNVKLDGGNKAYNAVYVNGGTLEMNDGSIISGTADSAVYVGGGAFAMKGGEIRGNTASYGGGVYVYGGAFAMSGGETSGNTATYFGGGVYVAGGTFTMSGGEISGNTASSYGGGVYVANSGTFAKSGGGTISDTNSATYGKAAYVNSSPAKRRDATAGPSVNLDSSTSGSAGGWESGASGVSDITYSAVSGGTWTLQSDGQRKSPPIGANSATKSRVSFTSAAGASIMIQLAVSSEANCDYAFISQLDNASATYSGGYYSGSLISGSTSVTVTIPVPTAGSHFIDIGYGKDGSVSSGSDCAWFKIIE